LEHESVDEPCARGDLVQLRALCDAADANAFKPVSLDEMSDQRTPAFMLQLSSLVQATVDLAVTEKVLNIGRLMPQASWERIGRYARVTGGKGGGAGAWFGVHFGLWKTHGTTPLWLIFSDGDFGRAEEVRPLIEPWATRHGILTTANDSDIAIALEIPIGEDKAGVIRSLADQITAIASVLAVLSPASSPCAEQE
jgi:hypothetical protein